MAFVSSLFLAGGAAPADLACPPGTPAAAGHAAAAPALVNDGVTSAWWSRTMPPPCPSPPPPGGGIMNIFSGLIAQLSTLAGALERRLGRLTGEMNAEGPVRQDVRSATLSSTGDPHLAETASAFDAAGNADTVNLHFDSMTAHTDLVSAPGIDGGYRVSTETSAPNATGITFNRSATVHTGGDAANVTLNADGSFAIDDGGTAIVPAPGTRVALESGACVSREPDGSFSVSAADGYGGTIETTLRVAGGGVDVVTTAANVALGGDIAARAAAL